MNTLPNIIVNPVKAFNQLKEQEKFPVATFIILLAIVLITMILTVPVSAKISEVMLSGMSLPDKQMDSAIQMVHKLRYLSMAGGFVMYVIMLFVYPLILFVIAWIFKVKLSYAKALRLIIYCFIALAIGDLVNIALVYFSGINNIQNMYDIMLTGVNRLTSLESAGASLYLFLSYLNPFQVWFIILMVIGLKILTDSGWTKSLIICLIYWLIVTIFPVITTYFSQTVLASKGLM